jgi:hypothetical protein
VAVPEVVWAQRLIVCKVCVVVFSPLFIATMSNNVQGASILDVLKKKMRATKEECEKYQEECEELKKKLHLETVRREEVKS